MDHVALLRTVLAPELVRFDDGGLRVIPDLDGATLGSLLTVYGVESAIGSKAATRDDMAEYLRMVADALQSGDGPLPTLSGLPPVESEPAF
jgi:hypothetical protein